MKAKLNFRSVVFFRAHRIVKQTGCSFSEALKQAWNRYREFKTRTVEELASQIKGFDSYYQMSDDGSVYRYWSSLQKEIRNQLSTLPGSFISAITFKLPNSNKIQSFI
ncbi:MAG: hypothetical protein A2066_14960 [Bacteroidetes bacterium GWB2_41_8]|nr:MAG: hypothetical protein A2066_14960 [Bacteroidetes bacterium GWB2_41_8]